ncbi:LppX_LprAFG lipoprotein [Mycolicibacterium thermoresistibile]
MQTRSRHAGPKFAVRNLFALFALLALVVGLAGCSSGEEQTDQSDEPTPDAATLLEESTQTTRDLDSVHLKLAVQGEIAELPIETLEAGLTNVPEVGAQGIVTVMAFGQRLENVDFVVADGTLYAEIFSDDLVDLGPAADIYDVSAILNPDLGLANLLANFSEPTVEGRETINGVSSVHISGTVTADAVNAIAPQIGATGPVPAGAWIREDGEHDLVQAQLEPNPGTTITMTLSDWNSPVTVTKPAV